MGDEYPEGDEPSEIALGGRLSRSASLLALRTPKTPENVAEVMHIMEKTTELLFQVRARLDPEDHLFAWNPDDSHADVTLTYACHCATKSGGGLYRNTRGVQPLPYGHSYFEVHYLTQVSDAGLCIGLATELLPLNMLVGSTETSIGVYSSGDIIQDGNWSSFGEPWGAGTTVGLLVEISDAPDGTTGCHGVDEAPKVVAEPRPGDDAPKVRVKIQVRINGEPAGDRDIEMVVASTLQLYPTASLYAKGTRVLSGFAAGDLTFVDGLPIETRSIDGVYLDTIGDAALDDDNNNDSDGGGSL